MKGKSKTKKTSTSSETTSLPFLDDVKVPVVASAEEPKEKALSPFDFVNAINFSKAELLADPDNEKFYNPYLTNRALSYSLDTVILANEMNIRWSLPKKMQFDFLVSMVKPRKRFNKWLKSEKVENIDLVKQYYQCNTRKALDILRLLTHEQIEVIKSRSSVGGPE